MKATHIGIASFSVFALMNAVTAVGLRLNFTDSAPHGIWIERTVSSVSREMLVSVCPPDLPIVKEVLTYGDCPNDVVPLFKAVRAIEGDIVALKAGFPATVNDQELPNTAARDTIPAWPDGKYTVMPGQVWIFSTYSPRSFDSRYFGPVPTRNILGEATPILVDGPTSDMTKGVIP